MMNYEFFGTKNGKNQVRCKKHVIVTVIVILLEKMLCEIISDQLGFPSRDQLKIQKSIKQKKRQKRKSL